MLLQMAILLQPVCLQWTDFNPQLIDILTMEYPPLDTWDIHPIHQSPIGLHNHRHTILQKQQWQHTWTTGKTPTNSCCYNLRSKRSKGHSLISFWETALNNIPSPTSSSLAIIVDNNPTLETTTIGGWEKITLRA